jgi:hypothetical protein
VDKSSSAPANRRAALATGTAFCRSTHHCADETVTACAIKHIPSRSITLIGTAVSWQAEGLRFIRRSHNGQAG